MCLILPIYIALYVNKALSILSQWNGAKISRQTIKVNQPQVWRVENTLGKMLVEPFIQGF